MTQLLERRLEKARSLPDSEQDAFAALILEEIEDDRRWDEAFTALPDRLSEQLNKVRQSLKAGRVRGIRIGIDELCTRD